MGSAFTCIMRDSGFIYFYRAWWTFASQLEYWLRVRALRTSTGTLNPPMPHYSDNLWHQVSKTVQMEIKFQICTRFLFRIFFRYDLISPSYLIVFLSECSVPFFNIYTLKVCVAISSDAWKDLGTSEWRALPFDVNLRISLATFFQLGENVILAVFQFRRQRENKDARKLGRAWTPERVVRL